MYRSYKRWQAGSLKRVIVGFQLKVGDPSGARTRDTLIKSQVLYLLS